MKKKTKLIKIFKKLFKFSTIFLVVILMFLTVLITLSTFKKPLLDRNWEADSKILPSISFSDDGNFVSIKNLRDWRYEKDKVVSYNYYAETFDLNKVKNSYLLFNPFGQWEGVGHSFFVFEFEDGKEVSISIEARREKDEPYKVERGLINEYEIWYAVGSSADFLTRRAIYNEEDLYMYPLLISATSSKALLIDMLKSTKKLETEPGFYNTITSNCTNLLAESANRVKPGSVPWHYARIFTGYADDQLYDLGFIPHDKPFNEIYESSRIDIKIKDFFEGKSDYSKEDFWLNLKNFSK
jgi:hypothetical protein